MRPQSSPTYRSHSRGTPKFPASPGKSHVLSLSAKRYLTPLMRPQKFPDTLGSLEGNTKGPGTTSSEHHFCLLFIHSITLLFILQAFKKSLLGSLGTRLSFYIYHSLTSQNHPVGIMLEYLLLEWKAELCLIDQCPSSGAVKSITTLVPKLCFPEAAPS